MSGDAARQLAKELLQALDRDPDPDRLAYVVQKERDDRAALEAFYVSTGQRAAADVVPERVVAVWDYASRPQAAFAIGVLSDRGAFCYDVAQIAKPKRAATLVAMRRRGIPIAATYGSCDIVWLIEPHAVGVWSTSGALANRARSSFDDAPAVRGLRR